MQPRRHVSDLLGLRMRSAAAECQSSENRSILTYGRSRISGLATGQMPEIEILSDKFRAAVAGFHAQ